jgi:hypothetical protein
MPGDSFPSWGVRVDRLACCTATTKVVNFVVVLNGDVVSAFVYVPSAPAWKLRERFTERPFR